MNNYRNLIYGSIGYNTSFGNETFGVARRDYFRLIHREIIGVLDFSLPFSEQYYTKHVIRKGLQVDLYSKNNFRIPFMFASSTIIRSSNLIRIHDITGEFSVLPGIYKEKFSLGLDLRYEVIVFRQEKYSSLYLKTVDTKAKNHWTEPMYGVIKAGIFGGLNYKRLVLYAKVGFENNLFLDKKYFPIYSVIGIGYKCGTKPMRESKKNKDQV